LRIACFDGFQHLINLAGIAQTKQELLKRNVLIFDAIADLTLLI
jgi:hypothetical protein